MTDQQIFEHLGGFFPNPTRRHLVNKAILMVSGISRFLVHDDKIFFGTADQKKEYTVEQIVIGFLPNTNPMGDIYGFITSGSLDDIDVLTYLSYQQIEDLRDVAYSFSQIFTDDLVEYIEQFLIKLGNADAYMKHASSVFDNEFNFGEKKSIIEYLKIAAEEGISENFEHDMPERKMTEPAKDFIFGLRSRNSLDGLSKQTLGELMYSNNGLKKTLVSYAEYITLFRE